MQARIRTVPRRATQAANVWRVHTTCQAVDRRQAAWVNQLTAGLTRSDLNPATRVLCELSTRLETDLSQAHSQQGADHER